MRPLSADTIDELMLDGNAVAGLLYEVFGIEMTTSASECATCGRTGELGSLHAFTHAPGVVLRCPTCHAVMLRVARTPRGTYVDARGLVYVRLA